MAALADPKPTTIRRPALPASGADDRARAPDRRGSSEARAAFAARAGPQTDGASARENRVTRALWAPTPAVSQLRDMSTEDAGSEKSPGMVKASCPNCGEPRANWTTDRLASHLAGECKATEASAQATIRQFGGGGQR